MADDDPLTKEEIAMRRLMATPKSWAAWCERKRREWELRMTDEQREAWRLHKGRVL